MRRASRHGRRLPTTLLAGLIIAAPLVTALPAHAAANAFTWTGSAGDGAWATPGNWVGGVAPHGSGITVTLTTSSATDDNLPGLDVADLILDTNNGSLIGQSISVAAIDHPHGGVWQIADDLVLSGTTVSGADNSLLVLAGALSGTGGLTNLGPTATTQLTGTTPNTFTGVLDASEGTVELDKTAGVQAFGGVGQASDFNPTGTLLWQQDDQAPPNATIGTDGADAVIDLNNRSDTVANVSNAAGTVQTGNGTLTVSHDIHNNNTSGTISGRLAVPANVTVTLGDGDPKFPSTSDNSLDISASLDIPGGSTVQVISEGATTLTGGDAGGGGSGGGGTLALDHGSLGIDGDFSRTSVSVGTGVHATVGGHLRSLATADGSVLTPGRSPSDSTDSNPLDVDNLVDLAGELDSGGQANDSLTGGDIQLESSATFVLNGGDPEAPFTVLRSTDGGISGTFAGLPQGGQLPNSSLSIDYASTLVRLVGSQPPGPTFTWFGGGDGVSWSDAGNWVDGVAPAAADTAATVVFPASQFGDQTTDDVPGFAPTLIKLDASTGSGHAGTTWSISGTVSVPDAGLVVDSGPAAFTGEGSGQVIPSIAEVLTATLVGDAGSVTYQGPTTITVAPASPSGYGGGTSVTGKTFLGAGSVPGNLTVGDTDGRAPLDNGVAGPTASWAADGVLGSYADLIVARDGAVALGRHVQTVGTLELTGIVTNAAGGGLTVISTIAYGDGATVVGDLTLSGDLQIRAVGSSPEFSIQAALHGASSTADLMGAGVVNLLGPSDFTGNLTVEDSVILDVSTTIAGVQIDERPGGEVGGTGTVGTVYAEGTLTTGLTAADVVLSGTLDASSGHPLTAASLSLQGTPTVTVDPNASPFTLVSITGTAPADGTFAGLPQGAEVGSLFLSYCGDGAGLDITLTARAVVCGAGPTVSTTTTLAAMPTTAAAGQSVTLTATVTAGDGIPTGQVSFLDGPKQLGEAVPVTNGSASLTFDGLATGSHQLTASYTGSGVFVSSNSAAVTVTITQSPTLTLSPGTVVYSRHASHAATGLTPDAVWTRAPDGTDTLLEQHARDPRLSADSTELYFRRGSQADGYGDHLWVRNLATGTETDLLATTATVVGYDAVGNGGLVFDQGCRLNVLTVAAQTVSQLGSGSTCGSVAPAESRDATQLAVSDPAGLSAGSATPTHVAGTVAGDISPSWSPDGATLAFLRPQPGTTTRFDIWTVPAAGGTPTRLTTLLDADALGPALPWSGDGSAVVSAGRVYGVFGLWRIPTTGGDPQLLSTTAGDPLTYVGAVVGGQAGTVATPAPVGTKTTPSANGGATILSAAVVGATGLVVRGGTVSFTDAGIPLGSAPVSEGVATLSVPGGLSAGGHTVTAGYSGTAVFAASSGSAAVTVATPVKAGRAAIPAVTPSVRDLRAVATAWTVDAATSRAWTPVSCARACSGSITLTAFSAGHVVVVGRATFSLRHGGRQLVLVHLSRAGKRLLAHSRRTRLKVLLVLHRRLLSSRTVVFRSAR